MSQTASWTPGPWRASLFNVLALASGKHQQRDAVLADCCPTVEAGDEPTIADVVSSAEMEANARLIAAAPELYAALVALLGEGKDGGDPGHVDYVRAVSMARAALAKAEGR